MGADPPGFSEAQDARRPLSETGIACGEHGGAELPFAGRIGTFSPSE